jgi:hypothetical protein
VMQDIFFVSQNVPGKWINNSNEWITNDDTEYCTCKFCILKQMMILLGKAPLGMYLGLRKFMF